jgi:hypothetical protein
LAASRLTQKALAKTKSSKKQQEQKVLKDHVQRHGRDETTKKSFLRPDNSFPGLFIAAANQRVMDVDLYAPFKLQIWLLLAEPKKKKKKKKIKMEKTQKVNL